MKYRNIYTNAYMSPYFSLLFILSTLILFIGLSILLISLNYEQIIESIIERKKEGFEDKTNVGKSMESASERLVKALQKTIRVANTLGRKMLSPEMWNERLLLINKSPMDLARMHIINNS